MSPYRLLGVEVQTLLLLVHTSFRPIQHDQTFTNISEGIECLTAHVDVGQTNTTLVF